MMIGKRSISRSTTPLPHTTTGTLTSSPSTTSRKFPCDAPAMASTLSMPITASAMMMVFIAPTSVWLAGPCAPSS